MRLTSICATALSAGAIVLGGTATPVAATEQPKSTMVITMWDSSKFVAEQLYEVVLKCEPPGGSHWNPQQACATLASVSGNFDRLHATGGTVCPMIYQPVHIEVGGNWRDRVVRFQRNYPSRCSGSVESAGVF